MTRHLATLRARLPVRFRGRRRLYLKPRPRGASAGTHHHLVVELHPYPAWLDVGLGCGSSIVASSALLPYPRSLPRPQSPFGGCLVALGFRNSPQFDDVAEARHAGTSTSRRLLRCFHDPLKEEAPQGGRPANQLS